MGTTKAKTPSVAAYRAIDIDYPLTIVSRIRQGGAVRFALTSSFGANARLPFMYTRIKGELEDAITRLEFASLTIVRPRLYRRKTTRASAKGAYIRPSPARHRTHTTVYRTNYPCKGDRCFSR